MDVVKKLYELNGDDFNKFCLDILQAEYAFSSCHITDGANDKGIDIYAEKNNDKYAIQVKHKFKFTDEKFIFEINRYSALIKNYTFFIFITSGIISENIINTLNYQNVVIIDQSKLLVLIKKHEKIIKKYFSKADENIRRFYNIISKSSISIIISIFASVLTLVIPFSHQKDDKTLAHLLHFAFSSVCITMI